MSTAIDAPLSPDTTLGLPGLEEPRPKIAGPAKVANEARPELADHARTHEGEDVVRLGLPHELADEVRAYVQIRILKTLLELLQREVAVPQEIGTALPVREALTRRGIEHLLRVSDSRRRYTPAVLMPQVTGDRLGPYEVIGLLGAGAMGEVYRARDTRLGREVAVKVLPAAFTQDQGRLSRFEQEARAAGALSHPNLLALYDVGVHDGVPYLVTELLEGKSLRDVLLPSPLPPRRAIEMAIQMARGLAAAHDKGIVHCDLKPANLFVTSGGHVKILDFGLAKLIQPDTLSSCPHWAIDSLFRNYFFA